MLVDNLIFTTERHVTVEGKGHVFQIDGEKGGLFWFQEILHFAEHMMFDNGQLPYGAI